MPKVVDADQRRETIARAVWEVIRRDGLDHASVRSVAGQAGLSMGALRHYFPRHQDLLGFAMRLVMDRARDRIDRLDTSGRDAPAAAERMLAEVLPLDPDRLAEAEVWFAFSAHAQVIPQLRTLRDQADDDLRALCLRAVRRIAAGENRTDLELESERLYALVDGLTLHAVTRPDRLSRERMAMCLRRHLNELARV